MSAPTINIVTHNGTFHNDEVTAYTILNYLFPQNTLIRTRDDSYWTKKGSHDIIIDVGSVYDPSQKCFDHHQATFKQKFDDKYSIVMSSAGLIYKHYGEQMIDKFCNENNYKISSDAKRKAHNYFYKQFFVEVDAFDNGMRQYSDNFYEKLKTGEITQNYFSCSNLGYFVSKFNTGNIYDEDSQLTAFKKACVLVWMALTSLMTNYFSALIGNADDYEIIDDAMKKRFKYDKSGQILVVKRDCNSWRTCISGYESKHPDEAQIKFIIYPSVNKTWNIRGISDRQFRSRRDLLPLDEIKKYVSLTDEVTFVHIKLFIGTASSLQTCIEMGIASIKK